MSDLHPETTLGQPAGRITDMSENLRQALATAPRLPARTPGRSLHEPCDANIGRLHSHVRELTQENQRLTAARDEYRDNAVLHIRERDEARQQLEQARARFGDVTDSAIVAMMVPVSERGELRAQLDDVTRDRDSLRGLIAEILEEVDNSGETVIKWLRRAGLETP